MSNLKLNTIANFAGRGWTALLGFLFIPIYIKVLGIESWGLIGFFAALLAILNLLDMGLSTTLNRELARLSARQDTNREQRDLVRTLETVYWIAAALLGLLVLVMAPVIARYWINSKELPVETVTNAVRVMGLIFTFRFPFALYQGGLMGLQRQVLLNGILVGMGTLRGLGAVAVIWWISPTIQAFFIWQLLISVLQTFTTWLCLWKKLPQDTARPRFNMKSLQSIWRFAAGMTGIALVTVLLVNLDKMLLSKLLPLKQFGYYMVGAAASSVVAVLVSPFFVAAFPRFSQMVAADRQEEIKRLYHLLCQTVTCVVLPVVVVIAVFSPHLIYIWSHNPDLVEHSSLIVSLLIIGSGLNAIMNIPYAFQLANGWTKLALYQNIIAVVMLIPLLFVLIRYFGVPGAAANWIILNAGYVLISPHIMHRRLMRTEKLVWYFYDLIIPSIGIVISVSLMRMLVPIETFGLLMQFVVIGVTWALATVAAICLAPKVRKALLEMVGSYWSTQNV